MAWERGCKDFQMYAISKSKEQCNCNIHFIQGLYKNIYISKQNEIEWENQSSVTRKDPFACRLSSRCWYHADAATNGIHNFLIHEETKPVPIGTGLSPLTDPSFERHVWSDLIVLSTVQPVQVFAVHPNASRFSRSKAAIWPEWLFTVHLKKVPPWLRTKPETFLLCSHHSNR